MYFQLLAKCCDWCGRLLLTKSRLIQALHYTYWHMKIFLSQFLLCSNGQYKQYPTDSNNKTAFSQRQTTWEHDADMLVWFCDLDLDPMTLIYNCDLDILKMYPHIKTEVSRSRLSKFRAWTDRQRQTDRQTEPNILPRCIDIIDKCLNCWTVLMFGIFFLYH